MTLHPYIGSQNSRERQREMMAQITAYTPVAGEVRPGGRAAMLDVPAAELAVAVHQGALADLDRT
jgi:hypothetical protein